MKNKNPKNSGHNGGGKPATMKQMASRWNDCKTLGEVARRFKKTKRQVSAIGVKLRRMGYDVKKFEHVQVRGNNPDNPQTGIYNPSQKEIWGKAFEMRKRSLPSSTQQMRGGYEYE